MNLAAFFMGLAGPLVVRVLTQLGIGIVSYAGVVVAVNAAIDSAKSNYSGLPSAIASLFALAGVNVALGIVFGALAARMSLAVLKRFTLK